MQLKIRIRDLSIHTKLLLTLVILTLGTSIFITIIVISKSIPERFQLLSFMYDITQISNEITASIKNNNNEFAAKALERMIENPFINSAGYFTYHDSSISHITGTLPINQRQGGQLFNKTYS